MLKFEGIVQEAKQEGEFRGLPLELKNETPPWLGGLESNPVQLLKTATAVKLKYSKDLPFPCTKQYPLPKEAMIGLTSTTEELWPMFMGSMALG